MPRSLRQRSNWRRNRDPVRSPSALPSPVSVMYARAIPLSSLLFPHIVSACSTLGENECVSLPPYLSYDIPYGQQDDRAR
ncbi:hypothetical protein GCM10010326_19040 [Streptomyces xanthochromogenes]|uniref:Uncharacterized protein n=1 Tax=Streptomyces xanthochromogenes TaxID=67384 RepID=A0ABQ2ZXH8_9ACTN|nr:hypothetical protein GCM10010326_19040 [Streptomyces xanthochromogenes]